MTTEVSEQAEDAAQPAPPETSGEAPAAAPAAAVDVSAMEPDDIGALLYKDSGKVKVPAPAAPVVEAQPEPPAAAPAEEQQTPEGEKPPEEAAPAEDPPLPNRIPTAQFDEETQRAMRTMHAMNGGRKPGEPGYVALPSVLKMLSEESRPTEAASQSSQPSAVEQAISKVTQIKTSLVDLHTKRGELVNEGGDPSDIDGQIAQAEDSLIDAKMDAKIAERDDAAEKAQRAAKHSESVADQRKASKQAAINRFPTAGDRSTPLGALIAQKVTEMQSPSHPDHALLFTTNVAMRLAREAADELAAEAAEREGIPFEQALARFIAKPKAAAPAPKAEPATRKILPASGTNRTTTPPEAASPAEVLAAVGNDPDAAQKALYGELNQNYL